MKGLSRPEAVLLGVLCTVGAEVLRTRLVKLVYLLDNARFEQLGDTLTGFTYHWDHYGPNTVDNALTETLAKLSSRGLVVDTQKLTPYENYANYYRCSSSLKAEDIPLDTADWAFIHSIVKQYGRLSRQAIVRESKRTPPMQGVQQYKVLHFVANPTIAAMKADFFSDEGFVKATREALAQMSDLVELDTLREQVA